MEKSLDMDIIENIDIIENTSIENTNIQNIYPVYEIIGKNTKPNLVLDLNNILIYYCNLVDLSELEKYCNYKNFLLIYKDFDMNLFIIYYRNYLREFLLELNNYYDIYIYSSLSRLQTDLFISCINHLIGINVFKKVFIKQSNIKKELEQLNLDEANTIIIDTYKHWKLNEKNLIYINIFRGPNDINYDTNKDLLYLKTCLLRIHKLFIDNSYDDIRKHIQECIMSIENT